jgi:hypothetical protein
MEAGYRSNEQEGSGMTQSVGELINGPGQSWRKRMIGLLHAPPQAFPVRNGPKITQYINQAQVPTQRAQD